MNNFCQPTSLAVLRVQNGSRHFGHPFRRFLTQEIEKMTSHPLIGKINVPGRHCKHFISEGNAAMKHTHTKTELDDVLKAF